MKNKVLIIEDTKQTQNILCRCLDLEGFETLEADTGRLGLLLAQQHLPSLIVCDILLPDMNGYELLSALKESSSTAIIPVIFLTTAASNSDNRKGMQLGAEDCILKPPVIKDFLRMVAVQIEKRSLLKRCYEANFEGVCHQDIERQDYSSKDSTIDKLKQEDECHSKESATTVHTIFPSSTALRPVFDFIEANYQKPITLVDVAQAAGYSPAYLTSQVGEQTKYTVNRWIIERRMLAARSLLQSSTYKIEKISALVGYQHTCHFSRQFRKHHGLPPNAWRTAQLSKAKGSISCEAKRP